MTFSKASLSLSHFSYKILYHQVGTYGGFRVLFIWFNCQTTSKGFSPETQHMGCPQHPLEFFP